MADAVAVQVAKAVTAQLAIGSFSQPIQPERSYADWDLILSDDDLHIDVVLVIDKQKSQILTRGPGGKTKYTVPVDIGIRQRLGQKNQNDSDGTIAIEDVDVLMLLEEQISNFFDEQTLEAGGCPQAVWQETEIRVSTDTKMLRENRQFMGIVRVTFTVIQ